MKYSPAVTTRQKSTYRSRLGLRYALSETRLQKEKLSSDGKKTERTNALNVFLLLSAGMRKIRRVEVHKHAKKKERTRPISSHLDRSNLANKGFIIWLSVKFFLRDAAGIPERAR